MDRLRRIVTTQPRKPAWRLARALAIAGVSLFVILRPSDALEVAAVIVGGYGLFFGVGELLQVVAPPLKGGIGSRDIDIDLDVTPRVGPRRRDRGSHSGRRRGDRRTRSPRRTSRRRRSSAPTVRSPSATATRELCGRPLNEVTFAGTHNSMAAADEPGWYFAAHRGGIADAARLRRPRAADRHPLRDSRQARATSGPTSSARARTGRRSWARSARRAWPRRSASWAGSASASSKASPRSTCATRSASSEPRRSRTGCARSGSSSTSIRTSS